MKADFEFIQDGEKVECFYNSTIDVKWNNENHIEELEIFEYINKDNEKMYIAVDDSGAYSFDEGSIKELKAELKNDGHLIVE